MVPFETLVDDTERLAAGLTVKVLVEVGGRLRPEVDQLVIRSPSSD